MNVKSMHAKMVNLLLTLSISLFIELEEHVTATDGRVIHLRPGNTVNIRFGTYDGGVHYTRWGKNSCRPGAQLLYRGRVGGGHYSQRGNGASYMCMPNNPQYLSSQTIPGASYIYGAEYESANRIFGSVTHDYNVPCAVCFVPLKSTKLVIPARLSCPGGWTREYYGYYMSSFYNHPQNLHPVCVDKYPNVISGTRGNTNGILFYFMRVICGYGLPCSSSTYITSRAITCAVCTK